MRVLVVDDEPALRESVRRGLVTGGWAVAAPPDSATTTTANPNAKRGMGDPREEGGSPVIGRKPTHSNGWA